MIVDPGDLERAIIDRETWNRVIPADCGLFAARALAAALRGTGWRAAPARGAN